MAVSLAKNFRSNRTELIRDALQMLGVNSFGQAPTAEVENHAIRQLNRLLKAWQADGLQLWKMRRLTVFLERDKAEYNLGPNGDQATEEWDRLTQSTRVRVAPTVPTTTLEVDSTTGMTVGDFILVQLNSDPSTTPAGKENWHTTTIASITDSDTLELTDAIPAGAVVNISSFVVFYTTKTTRPLRFDRDTAHMTDLFSGNDRPITSISRQEYWRLSNKSTDGAVAEVYFDAQISEITGTGDIRHSRAFVFPEGGRVTEVLNVIVQYEISNMDTPTDEFDYPAEWELAIQAHLAKILAPAYGVPVKIYKMVSEIAKEQKDNVMDWDHENTSILLMPEYRGQIEGGRGGSY